MVFKKVYLFLLAMMTSLAVSAQGLLPDFSTEAEPAWYQVQFKGGACLADQGTNQKVKTANKAAVDAQKWQFIGDKKSFKMKSKKGNYVDFANGRFTTSKKGCDLKIVEAGDFFEIGRVGQSNNMNQWGGAGAGKEIGEYNQGDNGNALSFVAMQVKLPKFSTAENEVWYFIQFRNAMKAFADQGLGKSVRTANPEPVEEQLWK